MTEYSQQLGSEQGMLGPSLMECEEEELGVNQADEGITKTLFKLKQETVSETLQVVNSPITRQECVAALKKVKNRKARGLHEIPNEFLKHGGEALEEALVMLFNEIIEQEEAPEEWITEKLRYIHKSKSFMILDNYRGLSIARNIGKIFTRIHASRMHQIVEREGLLGEIQGANRKGRSTLHQVFILTTIIERARMARKKMGSPATNGFRK